MRESSSELSRISELEQNQANCLIKIGLLVAGKKIQEKNKPTVPDNIQHIINTANNLIDNGQTELAFAMLFPLIKNRKELNWPTQVKVVDHLIKSLIHGDHIDAALSFLDDALQLAEKVHDQKKIWHYVSQTCLLEARHSSSLFALGLYKHFAKKYNFSTPATEFFVGSECSQINYDQMNGETLKINTIKLDSIATFFRVIYNKKVDCLFRAELHAEIGITYLFNVGNEYSLTVQAQQLSWILSAYIQSFAIAQNAHFHIPDLGATIHNLYFELYHYDNNNKELTTLSDQTKHLLTLTKHQKTKYNFCTILVHHALHIENNQLEARRFFLASLGHAKNAEIEASNVMTIMSMYLKAKILQIQNCFYDDTFYIDIDAIKETWEFTLSLPRFDYFSLAAIGELYCIYLLAEQNSEQAMKIFSIINKLADEEQKQRLLKLKHQIIHPLSNPPSRQLEQSKTTPNDEDSSRLTILAEASTQFATEDEQADVTAFLNNHIRQLQPKLDHNFQPDDALTLKSDGTAKEIICDKTCKPESPPSLADDALYSVNKTL